MPLKDNDLMPIGKYKGTPMVKLTAFYLLAYYEHLKGREWPSADEKAILAYIEDNKTVLEKERRQP